MKSVDLAGAPLELWGGHECTISRVGKVFADQSATSGHYARPDDIARFASLGLTRLRYPILWERVSPRDPSLCDWSASDAAMAELRRVGLGPIAGLIHHGSGPAYTDLLSPDFADGVARHAGRVAARYPDIVDWTPVNEPLTTARFALLYGHWYPHRRDEPSFWIALLNQIDAVRAAMRAVRAVNPGARLIQTEDLGRTYSTAALRDQADHDNLRRWGTWDLLCGAVLPGHFLWARLEGLGLADRLRAIADDPCPPDVIGINHYVTSDRFLDHRLERYPASSHGGNYARRFADVEAVRVVSPPPAGLAGALTEAWERYGRPLAVTEAHNACTREEQLRWLADAWRTAEALRARGVDIRAVTAWSLLGAHGWNSLLTRDDAAYECGVFDTRASPPRATAASALLRRIADVAALDHPVLASPGWWRRDERLIYPPCRIPSAHARLTTPPGRKAPIVITGATGTLGRAFAAACAGRALDHIVTDRSRLSLEDPRSIDALLDRERPWAVINTAGWVRVDDAEREADACMRANRDGSLALASACVARGIPFVTFSSDLVFDGRASDPYVEGDPLAPLNVYGRSKAEADRALLAMDGVLVVRTAAFFSPDDEHNFAVQLRRCIAERRRFAAADDLWVSPTYVPDLVRTVLDLVIDGETGLWHLVNDGSTTWAAFAAMLAGSLNLDASAIEARPAAHFGWAARRPARAHMRSLRGSPMPSLESAVERFAARMRAA